MADGSVVAQLRQELSVRTEALATVKQRLVAVERELAENRGALDAFKERQYDIMSQLMKVMNQLNQTASSQASARSTL